VGEGACIGAKVFKPQYIPLTRSLEQPGETDVRDAGLLAAYGEEIARLRVGHSKQLQAPPPGGNTMGTAYRDQRKRANELVAAKNAKDIQSRICATPLPCCVKPFVTEEDRLRR
jgi:hypothetical protein